MTQEWIGRRWCKFHTEHTTYLVFSFHFSSFILILHGLTYWFEDMPLLVFGIVMFCMMVSLTTLIGKHKIHPRTEQGQMQHLHLHNNRIIPESKEVLQTKSNIMMPDYVISTNKDPEPVKNLTNMKAAFERVYNKYTPEVMRNEKI